MEIKNLYEIVSMKNFNFFNLMSIILVVTIYIFFVLSIELQKKVTIDKFKRFDLLSEKESSVSFKNDELLLENFNQTQLHCNYKLNNHSKLISSEGNYN